MREQPKTKLSGDAVVEGDHREIDPATGMHKGYLVLSDEERAKGFVRPVRRNYIHTGTNPTMVGPAGQARQGRLRHAHEAIAGHRRDLCASARHTSRWCSFAGKTERCSAHDRHQRRHQAAQAANQLARPAD
jgi:hypothetical protein